ncbi:MAG: hypothetical protein J9259_08335, partial [Thermoplasmata archaeon YP2-bin.285]|nr:hypothetical protein [Candidatus Sysuiplasma superficiale]
LLNPNQYYPSKYLGPTSMSFSDFTWNASGSPTYNSGFMVSSSDANGNGVFFHLNLVNHNSSSNLYIDAASNIYIFTGAGTGFKQFISFLVLNGTTGAEYANWTIQQGSGSSPFSYYSGPNLQYPSLYWNNGPGSKWGANYSIPGVTSSHGGYVEPMSKTNFLLLPAAVGGVQVSVQVTFGAYSGGGVPSSGGPFSLPSNNPISSGSVSANFLELFGYLLPYNQAPWLYFPASSGVPYGQTIPFTGIYWY